MLNEFLKNHITSKAGFITANGYGYGQVEPNHLSAQRTSQVYAQLPAAADIDVLEQGQFVKYDYANGVCNFTGAGEWMLVFNEIKLYRENQLDCEFAMIKDNYQARVYSPLAADTNWNGQSRYLNGVNAGGHIYEDVTKTVYCKPADGFVTIQNEDYPLTSATSNGVTTYSATYKKPDVTTDSNGKEVLAGTFTDVSITFDANGVSTAPVAIRYLYDDVTAKPDMYEIHYNEDPFHFESNYHEKMMPAGTTMVPRVFKTNVGDIMTTNTIKDTSVSVGQILVPNASNYGILEVTDTTAQNFDKTQMQWQVVKVYTMPDHQPGVKVMRIA